MFQFTGLAFLTEYLINKMGCPIRVPADQFVFANPRSFSQLVTPFIASENLGIHRTPLVTFFRFLLEILTRYYWFLTSNLYFLPIGFFSYISRVIYLFSSQHAKELF